MPRRKSEQMTPLELEIMQVLWETGPATVQTVQRELKRELAYTTVQTMLTVLHRKEESETDAQRQSLHLPACRQPHEVYRSCGARVYRSPVWRLGRRPCDEPAAGETSDEGEARSNCMS
jgi:hypothetical protein